jgi:hypothetical protein
VIPSKASGSLQSKHGNKRYIAPTLSIPKNKDGSGRPDAWGAPLLFGNVTAYNFLTLREGKFPMVPPLPPR